MAKWLRFNRNVDFRHKSRAVTAYRADSVVYVPNHIIDGLPADSYEETENPNAENDGRTWLNG